MITNFFKNENRIDVNYYTPGGWINVINPTSIEVSALSEKYHIPIDFIQDILDVDERSRIEIEDNWLLIIARIPLHHQHNGIPFITVPLGILISKTEIITICSHENEITNGLITASKNNRIKPDDQINFILNIFLLASTWFLKYLKQINSETNIIEQDLEKSTKNKELHKLLLMEKCLVFFITSLKSNELLLAKLKNLKHFKFNEDNEDLLEDVVIENRQALEMANIYSDIQSGMMDAFASVISNNLNLIMKRLTSVTIILMIPTLIASLYGMNVPNFFENTHYAFIFVLGISVFLSMIGVFLFKKKNWF